MDQKSQIIEGAVQMFMKYGIKAVTMDDVARELSISKKTIYQFVKNKSELVDAAVDHVFNHMSNLIECEYKTEANAIDVLINVDEAVCGVMENHNPSLDFQLMKYYPEIHQKLEDKRKLLITKNIKTNLRQGIAENLYRSDINIELIAELYYGRMSTLKEDDHFIRSKGDLKTVMKEILIYHVNGIATEEGRNYLHKQLLENQNLESK